MSIVTLDVKIQKGNGGPAGNDVGRGDDGGKRRGWAGTPSEGRSQGGWEREPPRPVRQGGTASMDTGWHYPSRGSSRALETENNGQIRAVHRVLTQSVQQRSPLLPKQAGGPPRSHRARPAFETHRHPHRPPRARARAVTTTGEEARSTRRHNEQACRRASAPRVSVQQ